MKTILITGANRGIGLEFAKQYSGEGWKVIACCRKPQSAVELQKLAGKNPNIDIFMCDVTDEAQIKELSAQIKNKKIDILLNNAGIYGRSGSTFGNTDKTSWLKVLETNTIAPLKMSEALVDQVAASELKIIAAISSEMGSIGANSSGNAYLYRSSKAALNAVIKSMSIDLKPKNITAIALHPGWVKTEMGGEEAPLAAEESVAALRKVLSNISFSHSGQFLNYSGKIIEW